MDKDKPERERHTAAFDILNRLGLHARAAALLAETASRFEADVVVAKGEHTVNAKSIMELMLLAAAQGSTVLVTAEGADARAAIEAIGELIADRFREQA